MQTYRCDIAAKAEELNWAYDEIIRLRSCTSYYASGNQYQSMVQIINIPTYIGCLTKADMKPKAARRTGVFKDAEWYLRQNHYFLGWYDSARTRKNRPQKYKSNPNIVAYENMRGSGYSLQGIRLLMRRGRFMLLFCAPTAAANAWRPNTLLQYSEAN